MRISVSTWNANEFLQRRRKGLDLASWLQRADDKAAGSNPDEAPAIYAIAFQETVLLPNALVGIGAAQLSRYESIIKNEIDSHVASSYGSTKSSSGEGSSDSQYSLISKKVSGGVALLVYARESLSAQISEVLTAYMPCGPLWMSNKGAVGIRLTLGDSARTSFTFLSCHLAPHDHNAERRNADWASIVSGLIFASPVSGTQHQIYDTTFLFVAGDLNYRLSRTHPERLALTQIGERLSPNRLPELLVHDQLRIEQQKGNTLHGLQEGEIRFPPSYKFVKGTDRYKNFAERVPAWCDRVMYAGPATDSVTVEQYRSTTSIRTSDHKPVAALFLIQFPSSSQSNSLSVRSPYPVDPQAPLKRALGLVLSKLVGAVWAILRTIGFGSPWVGAAILLLHTAAVILEFDYIGHLQALWHWLRTADKLEAYNNFAMATTERVQAFIDERTDIFFGPFKSASKQS